MAATLLQLQNRLRALLREEQISAIDSSDLLTTTLTHTINAAMRRILDDHDWTFLQRDDGILAFPQAFSGVNLVHSSGLTVQIEEDSAMLALLQADDFVYRFLVRGSVPNPYHPHNSHLIVSAASTGSVGYDTLTLDSWSGRSSSYVGTADWLIYTNETSLPDTVARVHSVRDETGREMQVFEHQATGIDPWSPTPTDMTGPPEVVVVGGTTTNTTTTGSTGTSGMRLAIYPIFNVEQPLATYAEVQYRRIHYRYTYRFAAISAATDALTGVPEEITDLVVRRAFVDCLMGNIQNDVQRGGAARAQLEMDLREARARDVRDPMRRLVPRPFGSGRRGLHPNHRWATREVPAP